MGKRLDLKGQRFGKLTALEPVGRQNGNVTWLCRCDCGRETVVRVDHLRSGHSQSCGCQQQLIQQRLTFVDGTCVEMLRNKKLRSNNTSGTCGVNWESRLNQWRASICFQGKRMILGRFDRYEDAVKARLEAEHQLHDTFIQAYSERIGGA